MTIKHLEIDPIHKEGEYWYFWDETWADRHGPYKTEEAARYNFEVYIEFLNEGYFGATEDA